MTEEKRNRILAAVTVNVILLIAILLTVCIYTLVRAVQLKNTEKKLIAQIEYCKSQEEHDRATLEYYKSEGKLKDLAYEYGFIYPNNR